MFKCLPIVLLLAGCGKSTHDVAYYEANKPVRDFVLTSCANNPGELRANPDCINASTARGNTWFSRELPPLVLTKEREE